jgi:hypothetical protein
MVDSESVGIFVSSDVVHFTIVLFWVSLVLAVGVLDRQPTKGSTQSR